MSATTGNAPAVWTAARHPLARFLRSVAEGTPAPLDGSWVRVTPWSPSVQAVLSFGGHSILAVSYDISDVQLTEMGIDGWGIASTPQILTQMAGPSGWIGLHESLFLGRGRGEGTGEPLVSRPDLAGSPVVERARRVLTEVQVMGFPDPEQRDVVVLAHGVGGLREVDVDVAPERRGAGHGRELLRRALHSVPENELVAASVFAGDAAMINAFLGEDFSLVGSIQYFSTRPERR